MPVCHTQAKNYDELMKRTKEAITLCLSIKQMEEESYPKFLGLQQLEIEV